MANFITDIFTGKPAKEAADKSRNFFDQTRVGNNTSIDTGLNTSLASIGANFGNARDVLTGGYNQGLTGVTTGFNDATSALNSGASNARGAYGDASGYYDQGRGAFDQAGAAYGDLAGLGTKYGGATTLALNALGANGQPGQATARDAFTAGPGYSFNMDQGLEAINRRRAAGGMLDSGNADRDAQTFGAGLASNEYDKWLNNLLGFTGAELGATSGAAAGRAGAFTGQAGLFGQQAGMSGQQAAFENTLGQNQANLSTGRGAMLADLARQYGTNTAGNFQGEGTNLASLMTGAAGMKVNNANALAQPYAQTYKTAADAEMAGSGNAWKLGMAAAQMAMGMPPTGMGGPSAANSGAPGGGYFGAGGQLQPGPGYYPR